MAEVLIALDDYDDVFSDFDVRDYKTRALSRDFLEELKSRYRNVGPIDVVVLTVPKSRRRKKHEPTVARRITQHFANKAALIKRIRIKKALWALAYFVLGALVFGILINLPSQFEWMYDFALFPAWYLSWAGLDILREFPKYDKRLSYYESVASAKIKFEDEEKYEVE